MIRILACAAVATAAFVAAPAEAQAGATDASRPFVLKSQDIAEGRPLAEKFVYEGVGCKGGNVSPQLSWENPPEGTKSFVVTLFDPDAPTGSGWWHWVVANIPADTSSLPEGAGSSDGKTLPKGAIQTRTDFGKSEYGGACPPPGHLHRYVFTVTALGVEKIDVRPDSAPAFVRAMTEANSLGKATITTTFIR
jgi:Raf kinase inhibitor-like YbhB/YbcL family protein